MQSRAGGRSRETGGLYAELPYGAIGCAGRSYDRLPVPWCRGTLPAILKPVAKAFKAGARDIADGGPNDRYLSRFHRRGSGVPTMYSLRKEFPLSTGSSAPTREPRREDVDVCSSGSARKTAHERVRGGARCGRYLRRRRALMTWGRNRSWFGEPISRRADNQRLKQGDIPQTSGPRGPAPG